MLHLTAVHGYRLEGNSVILERGMEQLRITPVLPGVVQVRLTRTGWWDADTGRSWAVQPDVLRAAGLGAEAAPEGLEAGDPPPEEFGPLPGGPPFEAGLPAAGGVLSSRPAPDPAAGPRPFACPPPAAVRTDGADLVITAGELTIRVQRSPVRLTFCDAAGAPILAEAGGVGWDQWRTSCEFVATPADRFYGTGQYGQQEHDVRLELSGGRYPVMHMHCPGPARLVVPVVVSSRGYAVLVDNPWTGELDFTHTAAGKGGTWRYAGDGGPMIYYFIHGGDLYGTLDRYTRLTGRPSLPPLWSFGLLQSKYGYRNRGEVEELARTFRSRGIPCDGIVLDLFWFQKMGDLRFDEQAFPRPAEMIGRLKGEGFHTIVIEEPYLVEGSRLYQEAMEQGYVGRQPEGRGGGAYRFPFWSGPNAVLVDFTNPDARRWWARQHHTLTGLDIDGWWTDLNEPEVHPPDMIHHGGPAHAVHNLQAIQMVAAVYRGQREAAPDKRVFTLSRSAWPGLQRYGAGNWSGDVYTTWAALAEQPALGLNMGLAGLGAWNTDIGGFQGDPATPELYLRWLQFGIFTPVCRPHGAFQDREPWAFGPEVEAGAKAAVALRYQLLPYTYTTAWQGHRTGAPLMRPLFLEFPDDPAAWTLRDQFLWGRDLLVAPVLRAGVTRRSVYVPAGSWYDFRTGRPVTGGRRVAVPAPLAHVPLLARAGAIIPLASDLAHTTDLPWDPLTVLVFPGGGESHFDLYEDDGQTYGYRRGEYAVTRLTCRPRDAALEIAARPPVGGLAARRPARRPARRWRVQAVLPQPPRRVYFRDEHGSGGELMPVREREALPAGAAGWRYDARTRRLTIHLPERPSHWRLLVE